VYKSCPLIQNRFLLCFPFILNNLSTGKGGLWIRKFRQSLPEI
jgi:hypothetical protein